MKKRVLSMVLCLVLAISVFGIVPYHASAAPLKAGTETSNASVKKIKIPKGKSLTYNGKKQTGVAAGASYTIKNNTGTKAGTYTAELKLKDKKKTVWSDGTTGTKKVKWSIAPKAITPDISLSKTKYTWSGKEKKPGVTVKNGKKTLVKNKDYTVSYSNNINVGKASVKVKLKGNYKGSKTLKFTILPKGTDIIDLYSDSTDTITVTWEKQSAKMSKERIDGYQLQYTDDPDFSENKRTVKIKDYKKTSRKIKGLAEDTEYFLRIRTYKTIGEKTYYSSWSDIEWCFTEAQEDPVILDQDIILNENDLLLADAVYETQGTNTIISPISIHLALAMLLEGAEDQTKAELEQFLGVPKENLDEYVQGLMGSALNEEKTKTILANAFWYKPDQMVNPNYIQTLFDRYDAEISELDFQNAQEAASVINNWCSDKTNGLIPSIVSPDTVTDMADVLLNTVYFKASWMEPVESSGIKDETFYGSRGETVVPFLHSEETVYYENDQALAFKKPYSKKYSFIGILPKEAGDFTLDELDLGTLLASRGTEHDTVIASMPKFTIESGGEITDILKELGIVAAFSGDANLTGIADDLAVSDVIHKTKMILDENGTEAAAATAIVIKESAPWDENPIKITLDRPFAFMITDNETGNVLFLGKITDP